MRTLAEKSFSLIHKTKNQGCKEKLLGAYIKDLWPQSLAMCRISNLARLNNAQAESSSPTVGRSIGQVVQGWVEGESKGGEPNLPLPPEMRPTFSYLPLRFVYLTSQLRHSWIV